MISRQFSRLDDLAFDYLEAGEASRLEVSFEEIEVLEVVKGMDKDKVPGLDDFSMAFFKDCKEVIKDDIMMFSQTFIFVVSSKKTLMLLLSFSFRKCLCLRA
jgi:hypothetical protein